MKRLLLSIMSVLLLAGCVNGPDFSDPVGDKETTLRRTYMLVEVIQNSLLLSPGLDDSAKQRLDNLAQLAKSAIFMANTRLVNDVTLDVDSLLTTLGALRDEALPVLHSLVALEVMSQSDLDMNLRRMELAELLLKSLLS